MGEPSHALLRLLSRASGNLVAALGTTLLSVVVFSVVVPLAIPTVAVLYQTWKRGKSIAALRAAAEAFGGDDDKAARYARASALLDKWANEAGDFDAGAGL